MTCRSAGAEVTAHQAGLVTRAAAQHHPLLGEVVTVTRLLGAVTRGARQHPEAAALAARAARRRQLRGHTRSHEVTRGHTRSHEVTRGHTRSHEVTQRHTRSYEVTRGHTRSTQGHTRSRNVTRGHSGHRAARRHAEGRSRSEVSRVMIWETELVIQSALDCKASSSGDRERPQSDLET